MTTERDRGRIYEWLACLDHVTYYELFGLTETASTDEIRAAFHRFAEAFHPDVQADRSLVELAAITKIFRRGTEAYEALADPVARASYNDALARAGYANR